MAGTQTPAQIPKRWVAIVLSVVNIPSCRVGLYVYEETDTQARQEGDLFVEFLGEEAYLTLYDRASPLGASKFGPFDAKPDDYWVLGDNRNNAHDSRMWWGGQGGGVPMSKVTGRAMFAYVSIADAGLVLSRVGLDVSKPVLPPTMTELTASLAQCMRARPTVIQATPPA